MINLLFIGDIVGRAGRRAIRKLLPEIQKENSIDIIIANGENSAGGFGITEKVFKELLGYKIDCITMGNHTWNNKDIFNFISDTDKLIRPINYLSGTPGTGWTKIEIDNYTIGIINLIGQVYMGEHYPPLEIFEQKINMINNQTDLIIVDFHAEATGEKLAFAHCVDGKVTAIAGTHTHVQTTDAKILPSGTGYITDLGLTGAVNSILGMKKNKIIKKYRTKMPTNFDVGTGKVQLEGAIYSINPKSGCTENIKIIHKTD